MTTPDNRPCPTCGEPVSFHRSPPERPYYGERVCYAKASAVIEQLDRINNQKGST